MQQDMRTISMNLFAMELFLNDFRELICSDFWTDEKILIKFSFNESDLHDQLTIVESWMKLTHEFDETGLLNFGCVNL